MNETDRKVEHTATPWRAENGADGIWIGNDFENVAFVPGYTDHPQNIANAAFIVRAVNSHAAMRKALEEADLFAKNHGMDEDSYIRREIRAALQSEQGGET